MGFQENDYKQVAKQGFEHKFESIYKDNFDKIPEKFSPPIKSVLIKFFNEKIRWVSKQ